MSKIVGMSRNINLDYLNEVARLYNSGKTEIEINVLLNDYLSQFINDETNKSKTRNILMNIWVRETDESKEAKKLAIDLFASDVPENILLSHWCLMGFAYPVFSDVCRTIGKMDNNFDQITTKAIKNRLTQIWGERTTLIFSIDKIVKTLKDIRVLNPIPKNTYEINKYSINDKEALILITDTILFLKNKLYVPMYELNNCIDLFPFEYNITLNILEESNLFSVDKFGGELVVSRK